MPPGASRWAVPGPSDITGHTGHVAARGGSASPVASPMNARIATAQALSNRVSIGRCCPETSTTRRGLASNGGGRQRRRSGRLKVSQTARQTVLASSPSASA
jgi:hypothetical protein